MADKTVVASGRISISEEYFHYNARIIADSYPAQIGVIRAALSAAVPVKPTIRTKKKVERAGIDAGALNHEIRESLRQRDKLGMRFECAERDGFFLSDTSTRGFDFAYVDEEFNTIAYRNKCRGPLAFHGGEQMWAPKYRESMGIRELPTAHPVYTTPPGQPVLLTRSAPMILGEIQMGNWALLYYDLFKALAALESAALDLYIYVCPTGRLQELISEGTVNFRDARQVFAEKENVLRFPIWLIGIDLHVEPPVDSIVTAGVSP